MTDWSICPAVERNPKKISGAWPLGKSRSEYGKEIA